MRDKLCQSFALLPGCSKPRVWVSKPTESCVKEFICRRSVPPCALSVEGPTENELRRTIVFSSHPLEPVVYQRRLSHPSPGNDCNDVYMLICPGIIQESKILLST